MVRDVKESYTAFHVSHNPAHVYPSEWVIRSLLGSYPRLSLDKSKYRGAKILDVGFGDGRNWPLLRNAGFEVYGVEITEEIITLGLERARALGMTATLKLGTNSAISFGDDFFDYVLASSSCYYVDKGTTFRDNLAEYRRVMKPGGILLATLPEAGSAIFDGCAELGDGHVEIRNDPWALRNGYVFRRFRSEAELVEAFSPHFDSFSVGLCRDDYYGVQINLFLLVCRRKP
ncbi:MAG: class I SAM-dependent methyltransferase [Acidobacteriota bacterium]|nr:class I SAM-dependent methyltransferase [Acidobacteriota bacterium]